MTTTTSPPLLGAMDRDRVPGWLLALLDGDDVAAITYAERNCSTRYYIALLHERAANLSGETK